MSPRNTLICFDAFGTLFFPKTPVVQQYGEVARAFGLKGFGDDDLGIAFSTAFKNESKQNPNYGRATGLGAEKWWTNIITNTFRQVTDQDLPAQLARKLIHRFHCEEGYTLDNDVVPLLRRLRDHAKQSTGNIVVGVITNSDDRVPDVLRAFKLKVNSVRYGDRLTAAPQSDADIDFTIMSYDVGHEKPDRRIFDAAVETLSKLIEVSAGSFIQAPPAASWDKIYVGDEHKKDAVGALAAGWSVALIDREASQSHEDVAQLDNDDSRSLFEVFEHSRAVGFSSLGELIKRIP